MATTFDETMEEPMGPLDYNVPYDRRTQAWVNQRQTIVDRGLTNTADPADVEFVEAIRDMAGQLRFEMEGLTMKQNAELEQTRKDLATAQAQTAFYQEVAKELEGKMTVQLTMMQEELKASREAYTKTVTALTKTTEANAKVTNDLRKAIDAVRTSTATASGAGPSQTTQRPCTFTVKPKSIDTFSGEKSIAAVYSWLTTVENVFYLRAQECGTAESTATWARYAISYLKGTANEWGSTTWPDARTEIGWTEFKQKFTAEYLPQDALRRVQKDMDNLMPTSSIARFNDKFREFVNRLHLMEAYISGQTAKVVSAETEAQHVKTYILKLWKATDLEKKAGKDGPITRVYSAYMTAASMEAVKGTETQRSLDDVMRICDSIDRAHNDKPVISAPANPATIPAGDPMDLDRIETRFQALWSKAWQKKGGQEQQRTGSKLSCFVCGSKDHLIRDCKDPRKKSRAWKPQEGKGKGREYRNTEASASGGDSGDASEDTSESEN